MCMAVQWHCGNIYSMECLGQRSNQLKILMIKSYPARQRWKRGGISSTHSSNQKGFEFRIFIIIARHYSRLYKPWLGDSVKFVFTCSLTGLSFDVSKKYSGLNQAIVGLGISEKKCIPRKTE
jgi:hypothetical protein